MRFFLSGLIPQALVLFFLFSMNIYAETQFEKQFGLVWHQYKEGWQGQGSKRETSVESDLINAAALSLGVNFYKHPPVGSWFYGMGMSYLFQEVPKRRSHNRLDYSLLKIGYAWPDSSYQLIGEFGITSFFEQETSYGYSLGLELKTDMEWFNLPIAFKYQGAETDYEPRGQGEVVNPLRDGYTHYLAILFSF